MMKFLKSLFSKSTKTATLEPDKRDYLLLEDSISKAEMMLEEGRVSDAKNLLLQQIKLRDAKSLDNIELKSLLAFAYLDSKDYKNAKETLESYLASNIKLDDATRLADLSNLAESYLGLKEYEKARNYYNKTLKATKSLFGSNDMNVGSILMSIATLDRHQNRLQDSLTNFKKAEEIFKYMLSPEHPTFITLYNNFALLYGDMGNFEDAYNTILKCLTLSIKIFGDNHPRVHQANSIMMQILRAGAAAGHPELKARWEIWQKIKNK